MNLAILRKTTITGETNVSRDALLINDELFHGPTNVSFFHSNLVPDL